MESKYKADLTVEYFNSCYFFYGLYGLIIVVHITLCILYFLYTVANFP